MYDGEFLNDNCHGEGVIYYPDGKRFEGQWREGIKHGNGIYIYPDMS